MIGSSKRGCVYSRRRFTLDLPKEWLEARRAAEKFGLEFPPLTAVGALYTMDSATGRVKAVLPLSLSTMARRIGYLRTSVVRLGLLPAPKPPPDFLEDFVKAVFWGGRTLEYALMRAADGFAVSGDVAHYTDFTRLARTDSVLAPLITPEACRRMDALLENLATFANRAAGEAHARQETADLVDTGRAGSAT
jgi:hypothetical protein